MKKILLLTLFFISPLAHAQLFSLPQLTTAQTDPLFRNLAADLAFRSVEGISGHTRTVGYGFGFGGSGTLTSAASIAAVTGTPSLTYIPAAYFNVDVALPIGLGVEFGFLPTITYSGTTFNTIGGNAKWHFSKFLPMLPFDVAVRVMMTSSTIASTQQLSGATITVNYGATQFGSNLMIAKTLAFFEPYVSVGLANQASTLSYTGAVSLFGASFPAGTTTVTGGGLGFWFTGGFQLKFAFLTLGAQYDNLYGIGSGSTKVGFKF